MTKYLRYQYGVTYVNHSVNVHFRNSNKKKLIPAKFRDNNEPSINNQSTKFRINQSKQTVVTAALVRWFQNTSVSGFLDWITSDTKMTW